MLIMTILTLLFRDSTAELTTHLKTEDALPKGKNITEEHRKRSEATLDHKKKRKKKKSDTTDKINIKFSTWDFSGRDIYHPIYSFFLSPRSIHLVVFNAVDDKRCRVEYWLNTVQSRVGNSAVVLVGTHLDDKRCTSSFLARLTSAIEESYKKKFPFIKAIAFVSCRTGKYEYAKHQ